MSLLHFSFLAVPLLQNPASCAVRELVNEYFPTFQFRNSAIIKTSNLLECKNYQNHGIMEVAYKREFDFATKPLS